MSIRSSKFLLEGATVRGGRVRLCRGTQSLRTPPDADHAAQQPASGQLLVQAQQHLAQAAGVGVGDDEADVGGDGADIGDVVVDPLQFQQDGAQDGGRAAGPRHRPRVLDGLAEGGAVGESGIPGYALGQEDGVVHGHMLEQLFGALMRVEHTELEVEDGLARDREIEVAGLDDAGVNGADGNLEDAFAQGRAVDVPLALKGRQHGVDGKVFAQGMDVGPVVVEGDAAGIGMVLGDQAEPVLDLALLPVHGGDSAASEGKCGAAAGTGARRIR